MYDIFQIIIIHSFFLGGGGAPQVVDYQFSKLNENLTSIYSYHMIILRHYRCSDVRVLRVFHHVKNELAVKSHYLLPMLFSVWTSQYLTPVQLQLPVNS